MKKRTLAILLVTHCISIIIGFVGGIYTLPILIAPPAPTAHEISTRSAQAQYTGSFKKDLKGSDALHWGKGKVLIGSNTISFAGRLAPGPDYQLYLSPKFVETESDFNRLKAEMVRVGDVKTFNNFLVHVPEGIDPANYNTVIIWCESFGQFITSAKYR